MYVDQFPPKYLPVKYSVRQPLQRRRNRNDSRITVFPEACSNTCNLPNKLHILIFLASLMTNEILTTLSL
jgi:hypothetical protein